MSSASSSYRKNMSVNDCGVPSAFDPTDTTPPGSEAHTTGGADRHGAKAKPSVPQQMRYLSSLGLPAGIARELCASSEQFPLRLWVLDNSGSMVTGDGHKVAHFRGTSCFVTCSRWEELSQALEWQGQVAAHLQCPTEFRLLNPVLQPVACGYGSPGAEVAAVERLVRISPHGRTPLCAQIHAVVATVQRLEPELRARGERVVVVIASDGLSTDGDIAAAMRPLQALPVWVVVRLCTDDDSVVDYWNNVDAELELDMDVLDDLAGEAKEVTDLNPWLVYGAPLHRLREFGAQSKLLDLMDERALTRPEMFQMLALIFGPDADALPHPDMDWAAFEEAVAELLDHSPKVWDPLHKEQRPWISMKHLRRMYKPRKGILARGRAQGCTIS